MYEPLLIGLMIASVFSPLCLGVAPGFMVSYSPERSTYLSLVGLVISIGGSIALYVYSATIHPDWWGMSGIQHAWAILILVAFAATGIWSIRVVRMSFRTLHEYQARLKEWHADRTANTKPTY